MIHNKNEESSFGITRHVHHGNKLKECYQHLEQARAAIVSTYPKSSRKEAKALEQALDKIRAVQTAMHGRLLREFEDKGDAELLPTYLGRLSSDK
jgi:hypothetical protein